MYLKPTLIYFLLLLATNFISNAQSIQEVLPDGGGEYIFNPDKIPCVTPEQYVQVEKEINENVRIYNLERITPRSTQTTIFSWPLVPLGEAADECGYLSAMGYMDEDSTSPGILDYHCGDRTYDTHHGTDIGFWPYPWYRMEHDQVEVVAAADGVIYGKADGNFDKNCGDLLNNPPVNYLSVQHADGSRAYYYHLKKNSLTSKTVGQSIASGDYIGIAGSSGSSSAPHLHFEVWDGATRRDPFSGSCNHFNSNTWWASQKPYLEPAINMIQVGHVAPAFSTCPAAEIPNKDDCLDRGASAVFTVFMRQNTPGATLSLSLRYSNSFSYTDSWTYTINNNYGSSYYSWTRTLPTSPAGSYEFKATYNGVSCSKYFNIGNCTTSGMDDESAQTSGLLVYPNPGNGSFIIETRGEIPGEASIIEVYNNIGALIYSSPLAGTKTEMTLNVSAGIYFCRLRNSLSVSAPVKLIRY